MSSERKAINTHLWKKHNRAVGVGSTEERLFFHDTLHDGIADHMHWTREDPQEWEPLGEDGDVL